MGLPQASIAVIEVYPGVDDVYTIADHAPGVVRVVRRWNKVPYSHPSTEEYRATLGEARQLAAELRG